MRNNIVELLKANIEELEVVEKGTANWRRQDLRQREGDVPDAHVLGVVVLARQQGKGLQPSVDQGEVGGCAQQVLVEKTFTNDRDAQFVLNARFWKSRR